ncbi:unnamed protein product, partial [Rotaria socialis]
SSNRSDQIFNFTLKILVLFEIENRNQFQIQNRTSKFAIAIAMKKRIQNLIVKTNSKSNCKNKFKIIEPTRKQKDSQVEDNCVTILNDNLCNTDSNDDDDDDYDSIKNNDDDYLNSFKANMAEDFMRQFGAETAEAMLFYDIEAMLTEQGRSYSDFGIPIPSVFCPLQSKTSAKKKSFASDRKFTKH